MCAIEVSSLTIQFVYHLLDSILKLLLSALTCIIEHVCMLLLNFTMDLVIQTLNGSHAQSINYSDNNAFATSKLIIWYLPIFNNGHSWEGKRKKKTGQSSLIDIVQIQSTYLQVQDSVKSVCIDSIWVILVLPKVERMVNSLLGTAFVLYFLC